MRTIIHTKQSKGKEAKGIGTLLAYSDKMKSQPTESEKATLTVLEAGPYAFESQVVFGYYILDFVIPAKLVCVEIDGSSHDGKQAYDKRRDQYIKRHGLKVLRIDANDATMVLKRVQQLPDVANYKEKWRMAQDSATLERARSLEKKEALAQTGRKKGYVKPFYTPKREQAHVLAGQRITKRLQSGGNTSVSDLGRAKQEREARREMIKARLSHEK